MQANSHGAGSSSVTRITQRLEALSLCYCFVFTAISADIRSAGGAAHEGFRGLRSRPARRRKSRPPQGEACSNSKASGGGLHFPGHSGAAGFACARIPNDYGAFPSVADLTAPAFCPISVRRLRARRPFPPRPASWRRSCLGFAVHQQGPQRTFVSNINAMLGTQRRRARPTATPLYLDHGGLAPPSASGAKRPIPAGRPWPGSSPGRRKTIRRTRSPRPEARRRS
jgi:hypothetical protein